MLACFQHQSLFPPDALLILTQYARAKHSTNFLPLFDINLLQPFRPDACSPTEFAVRRTLRPGTVIYQSIKIPQSLSEFWPEVPE